MNVRTGTILACAFDAVVCAVGAWVTFGSGSDPATKGLDQTAAIVVTVLFLLTGAPAIALTLLRRAPVAALVLALVFPGALLAAFIAAVVAFGLSG